MEGMSPPDAGFATFPGCALALAMVERSEGMGGGGAGASGNRAAGPELTVTVPTLLGSERATIPLSSRIGMAEALRCFRATRMCLAIERLAQSTPQAANIEMITSTRMRLVRIARAQRSLNNQRQSQSPDRWCAHRGSSTCA